jgi:drug/metabolite transporter (DMT)-like permease
MNYPPSLVLLELIVGYVVCGIVAVMGAVVVWKIVNGSIDLSRLLTEKDGTAGNAASMARFQLLIFIFVIALSFFLVVISNIKIVQTRGNGTPQLPEVPNGVLALLGISASSYAVGKAIQHGTGSDDDGGYANTDRQDARRQAGI